MTAQIIDGRRHARIVLDAAAIEIGSLPRPPGLAVVVVGDDPASHIYVRSKVRVAGEVGIRSELESLPHEADEARVLAAVAALNARDDIDGILVQLPLPPHIDPLRVMAAVDPAKDVDGLHALNAGRLLHGADTLVPCTPSGCLKLIRSVTSDLTGANAVVIGASNIVGKPMAALLVEERATVTQTHVHTRGIARICREADIVVTAVGKPGLVRGDWIRPGAIVVDVGTTRVGRPDGGHDVKGDVAFEEAVEVAGALTPVPRGVGPMTIACLMENTVKSAKARAAALH